MSIRKAVKRKKTSAPKKGTYKEALSASDQIDMEEQVASYIFEHAGQEEMAGEESAADLSRAILKMVLAKFRPDLVNK
jgi:hypothetical protein